MVTSECRTAVTMARITTSAIEISIRRMWIAIIRRREGLSALHLLRHLVTVNTALRVETIAKEMAFIAPYDTPRAANGFNKY